MVFKLTGSEFETNLSFCLERPLGARGKISEAIGKIKTATMDPHAISGPNAERGPQAAHVSGPSDEQQQLAVALERLATPSDRGLGRAYPERAVGRGSRSLGSRDLQCHRHAYRRDGQHHAKEIDW